MDDSLLDGYIACGATSNLNPLWYGCAEWSDARYLRQRVIT